MCYRAELRWRLTKAVTDHNKPCKWLLGLDWLQAGCGFNLRYDDCDTVRLIPNLLYNLSDPRASCGLYQFITWQTINFLLRVKTFSLETSVFCILSVVVCTCANKCFQCVVIFCFHFQTRWRWRPKTCRITRPAASSVCSFCLINIQKSPTKYYPNQTALIVGYCGLEMIICLHLP